MRSCRKMRLEKSKIGSQPLQQIDRLQQRNMHQQQMVKDPDHSKEDQMINKNEVKTVTDKMNDFLEPLRTNLKFEYHEELNEYYVTVINPLTNETIKEIPPKKMLDMYAAMVGFMGILIDEKI